LKRKAADTGVHLNLSQSQIDCLKSSIWNRREQTLTEVTEADPMEVALREAVNTVRAALMVAGYDHAQIGTAMLVSGGALLACAKGREAVVKTLTEFVDDLAQGFAQIN
jgi:hypothetical protein